MSLDYDRYFCSFSFLFECDLILLFSNPFVEGCWTLFPLLPTYLRFILSWFELCFFFPKVLAVVYESYTWRSNWFSLCILGINPLFPLFFALSKGNTHLISSLFLFFMYRSLFLDHLSCPTLIFFRLFKLIVDCKSLMH